MKLWASLSPTPRFVYVHADVLFMKMPVHKPMFWLEKARAQTVQRTAVRKWGVQASEKFTFCSKVNRVKTGKKPLEFSAP